MGCLYRLSFPNGKAYIGITSSTLERRLSLHRSHAKTEQRGALQRAIRKYGSDSFTAEPLVIADDWGFLCDLEKRAIALFDTLVPAGYNLTAGGEGAFGVKRTPEQCAKISASKMGCRKGVPGRKGWKHTPDAIEKIRSAGKGRVFSDERRKKIGATKLGNSFGSGQRTEVQKRNMSAWQIGRPKSDAHRKAMSESHRGKPWSEARRAAQKAKANG